MFSTIALIRFEMEIFPEPPSGVIVVLNVPSVPKVCFTLYISLIPSSESETVFADGV